MSCQIGNIQEKSSFLRPPSEDAMNTTFSGPHGMAVSNPNNQLGTRKTKRTTNRQLAYQAAIGIHLTWSDFGGLVSTRSKVDREEQEL